MRNRPTRRSASGSGTALLIRTAARVPASRASCARKKFTMQPTKALDGRAALLRSTTSRRFVSVSDASKDAEHRVLPLSERVGIDEHQFCSSSRKHEPGHRHAPRIAPRPERTVTQGNS